MMRKHNLVLARPRITVIAVLSFSISVHIILFIKMFFFLIAKFCFSPYNYSALVRAICDANEKASAGTRILTVCYLGAVSAF